MSIVSKRVQAAKDLAAKLAGENPTLENGACLIPFPDIGATTGRQTLREAETHVDKKRVISKAVRNGDLEVFPSAEIQPINTLRVATKRLLSQSTVQVGGLYLCPVAKLEEVLLGLESIQAQFDVEVQSLGGRYDSVIEEHKRKNPDIAHLIERHRLSWGEFVVPFKFRINPALAVQPLLGESDEMVEAAAQSLWEEIAAEAKTQHRTSFAKAEKVTQKAVKAVARLRDKLVNLSFLHGGIDAVVDKFNEVFESLPKTGYLEGGDFHRMAHFVLSISDENNLRMMADGTYAVEGDEEEEIAGSVEVGSEITIFESIAQTVIPGFESLTTDNGFNFDDFAACSTSIPVVHNSASEWGSF